MNCLETIETEDAMGRRDERCPGCGHVNRVPESRTQQKEERRAKKAQEAAEKERLRSAAEAQRREKQAIAQPQARGTRRPRHSFPWLWVAFSGGGAALAIIAFASGIFSRGAGATTGGPPQGTPILAANDPSGSAQAPSMQRKMAKAVVDPRLPTSRTPGVVGKVDKTGYEKRNPSLPTEEPPGVTAKAEGTGEEVSRAPKKHHEENPAEAMFLKEAIKNLASKDAAIHQAATEVLGKLGPAHKYAIPLLVNALESDEFIVRFSAALALKNIGAAGDDGKAALKRLLKDKVQAVAIASFLALEAIEPDPGAVWRRILADAKVISRDELFKLAGVRMAADALGARKLEVDQGTQLGFGEKRVSWISAAEIVSLYGEPEARFPCEKRFGDEVYQYWPITLIISKNSGKEYCSGLGMPDVLWVMVHTCLSGEHPGPSPPEERITGLPKLLLPRPLASGK